jgi:hypothetical protein
MLFPKARRREGDGSLRVVYEARIADCRAYYQRLPEASAGSTSPASPSSSTWHMFAFFLPEQHAALPTLLTKVVRLAVFCAEWMLLKSPSTSLRIAWAS